MMIIKDKKAFTLAEFLVSIFVGTLIFVAAWSMYAMGWTWWYEVSPRIESQRIARLAIMKIIEGTQDSTTGFDIIGNSRYNRRNGISSAYYSYNLPDLQYDSDGVPYSNRIDFGLFEDYGTYEPSSPRNVRSFYLDNDGDAGLKAVYYRDGQGAAHKISSTSGITDLKFNKYVIDKAALTLDDYIIVVTATVEKDVSASGMQPYHIKVEYSDSIYLKNVQ